MRIFIFALFVASCYASPPLSKAKLPRDVVTQTVVLPQKTVTVQRDVPVASPPKLVTVTRPVPSVPKIVTIDKKVHVPSAPKIVTVHKQVSVPTQVVVPRPIPSPPRIITIEKPVPVPQTVIVDKPYLVPTPVIIPRPVPVYVSDKAAVGQRAPISLQPIVASGPLSRPLPTPLANAQSLVTGRTSAGAITVENVGSPILAGDKFLQAPLFAPAQLEAPLFPVGLNKSEVPLSFEQQKLLNYNLALGKSALFNPVTFGKSNLVFEDKLVRNLLVTKDKLNRPLPLPGKLNFPYFPTKFNAPVFVDGQFKTVAAPLTPKEQVLVNSKLNLKKESVLPPANLKA